MTVPTLMAQSRPEFLIHGEKNAQEIFDLFASTIQEIARSLGTSAQKILVFTSEHEFAPLVMDSSPRGYLATISLRGESNNLKSRIERISGMYFLEKFARCLGKRDEHVPDVLRKQRCPGSGEREYLQAMHYWGCVSVTPGILHVVVNRVIVSRNGLEGHGVRIVECTAGRAEDFA